MSIITNIKSYFNQSKILQNQIYNLKNSIRELEDQRWIPVGSSASAGLNYNRWIDAVKESRRLYRFNHDYHNAIRLTTAFTFGRGATFIPKDKRLNDIINTFIKDPDNKKCLFGSQAQNQLMTKLLKDGELYLMFFVNESKGTVLTRIADAFDIVNIVSEPADPQTELYYQKRLTIKKFTFNTDGTVTVIDEPASYLYRSLEYKAYKDYEFADRDILDKFTSGTDDCYIYHIIAPENDPLDNRGLPPFITAVNPTDENKRLNDILASYITAITAIAWTTKVKGTSADLASVKTAIAENFGRHEDATGHHHHRTPTAAINVEAEGGDELEPMERTGGLSNAILGGIRQQKLGMCSGTGLPETYFGDASTGNLATATSMELPVLKIMEQWQQFWVGIYETIFEFYLSFNQSNIKDIEDKTIQIQFPDIIKENLSQFITAVSGGMVSGSIPEPIATKHILTALGEKDIDKTLEEYYPEGETNDTEPKDQNIQQSELVGIMEIRKARRALEKRLKG